MDLCFQKFQLRLQLFPLQLLFPFVLLLPVERDAVDEGDDVVKEVDGKDVDHAFQEALRPGKAFSLQIGPVLVKRSNVLVRLHFHQGNGHQKKRAVRIELPLSVRVEKPGNQIETGEVENHRIGSRPVKLRDQRVVFGRNGPSPGEAGVPQEEDGEYPDG